MGLDGINGVYGAPSNDPLNGTDADIPFSAHRDPY